MHMYVDNSCTWLARDRKKGMSVCVLVRGQCPLISPTIVGHTANKDTLTSGQLLEDGGNQ